MWIMQHVFGIEEKYLLCKSNEAYGKVLFDEIMTAENSGHHDKRLKANSYRTSRIGLMWA